MHITIEKDWNGNEGIREGRNGRAYATGGRWQWSVLVDGAIESTHDRKRDATARVGALTHPKETAMTTKKKAARRPRQRQLGIAPKHPVLLRIDPAIIEFFREQADARGVGYQTLMHDVLASQIGDDIHQATCRNCERLESAIETFSTRKDRRS